jgi:hypothetical protein
MREPNMVDMFSWQSWQRDYQPTALALMSAAADA